MAPRSIADRLAQRDARRKTLQFKLGKQERARDTRRKILLGAFVLHCLEKGLDAFSKHQLPDWLRREFPGFLTREDDKALFPDLIVPDLIGSRGVKTEGAKPKAEGVFPPAP